VTSTEEFTEFAAGAAPRLRRTAFLLCGDWHAAEDLAQATLAKTFVSWRRIRRQDAVYAYASRTLVNTYLADRRRRRSKELLSAWLPEPAAPAGTPELRMVILDGDPGGHRQAPGGRSTPDPGSTRWRSPRTARPSTRWTRSPAR
jgi:DNA-directed RNA polymerase specialized sigma24 family protein